MRWPVIIAAAFTAGSMAWSPNAIAQSERWVNPDQPLPSPAVTESGIHNKSDEQASQRREPDGLERLKREGADGGGGAVFSVARCPLRAKTVRRISRPPDSRCTRAET